MAESLPEVFGRRFLLAHLLPAVAFVAAMILIFGGTEKLISVAEAGLEDAPMGIGILVALWILALLLLALNRTITRLLEGYGSANPLRALKFLEARSFRKLTLDLEAVEKEAAAAKGDLTVKTKARRNKLHRQRACRFPDGERWLLPTSFGNTIRSFEVYPRVMYGMEAIDSWFRLTAVLPKEFLGSVDDAKAQVDLWLNVWFLSSVVACIGVASLALQHGPVALHDVAVDLGLAVSAKLTAAAAAALAAIGYWRAVRAAEQWGHWVKAAFDLFRSTLAQQLGLKRDMRLAESRRFWNLMSRALAFAEPKRLQDLEAEFQDWKALGAKAKEPAPGGAASDED